MPFYFFDVVECARQGIDEIGLELPDDDAAANEALSLAAEMFHDSIKYRKSQARGVEVRVRNSSGDLIKKVRIEVSGDQ